MKRVRIVPLFVRTISYRKFHNKSERQTDKRRNGRRKVLWKSSRNIFGRNRIFLFDGDLILSEEKYSFLLSPYHTQAQAHFGAFIILIWLLSGENERKRENEIEIKRLLFSFGWTFWTFDGEAMRIHPFVAEEENPIFE